MGAKQVGIEITCRTPKSIILKNLLNKQMNHYEINAEFPFDSDRKRMTIVVTHDGRHIIMTKGADNIMLPRLKLEKSPEHQLIMKNLNRDLDRFATQSLRTLVMG